MWTTAKTFCGRFARIVLAGAAVLAWLVPATASAQTPVGSAVLYEVNEALGMIKGKKVFDPSQFGLRLARASLLGKEVRALAPDSPFSLGTFVQSEATSSVNLKTGIGPINGTLLLLNDLDPSRESLDTLQTTAAGTIKGELNLTTASQGFAQVAGAWSFGKGKNGSGGTFAGVFLIPFQLGDGQYFYVNVGPEGPGTACGPTESLCPLSNEEFTLGIPLTKLLVTYFE
jgi:hypothetical protein